jgi:uncharacterized protein YkwD
MRVWAAVAWLLLASVAGAGPAPDVVARTNAYRAAKGLKPLTVSPALQAAAEAHGRDMAKAGFFDHKGSDGRSVGARAKRQGYRFCLIAENIAKGQKTPAAVMQSWIASPGHRRNLELRKVTEIGVSRQGGDIWVMVLGAPLGNC